MTEAGQRAWSWLPAEKIKRSYPEKLCTQVCVLGCVCAHRWLCALIWIQPECVHA